MTLTVCESQTTWANAALKMEDVCFILSDLLGPLTFPAITLSSHALFCVHLNALEVKTPFDAYLVPGISGMGDGAVRGYLRT